MINCIVIDDEPLALAQMSDYIGRTPFLNLISLCNSPFNAISALKNNTVDLMYVDINMPDINGLDFVKTLAERPMIVFTTAYAEYAVEGFRVEAIDYLLKPFSYADFLNSAVKVQKMVDLVKMAASHPLSRKVFFKSGYKNIGIEIEDITYIESESEYVNIHIEGGECVMTLSSMKAIVDKLSDDRFVRVHRSYIVNKLKIKEITKNTITLFDHSAIPVGEQYKEALNQLI